MRRLSLRIGLESALAALSWFALSALIVGSLPAEVNANPAAEAHVSSTLRDNLKRQGLISEGVDQPSSITSGCVNNPFPTQPSRASYSAEFSDTTFSNGNRFRLTAWREPCANDPLRSAVFVRYTILTGSSVFVCGAGGSLQAFQNGTLYYSILEVWRYSATSNYLNYFWFLDVPSGIERRLKAAFKPFMLPWMGHGGGDGSAGRVCARAWLE